MESLVILKLLEKSSWRQALMGIVLPVLFNAGVIIGFSFLDSDVLQQFYVLGVTILFALLFYSLQERYTWHKEVYLLITILAAFVYSYGLYGFSALTGMRASYYGIVFSLFLILLLQLFWFYKLLTRKNLFLLVCAGLVLGETFWALSFLPLAALPSSVVLATVFYLCSGVCLNAARKILTVKALFEYFTISAIIIIAVVSTSLWMPQI